MQTMNDETMTDARALECAGEAMRFTAPTAEPAELQRAFDHIAARLRGEAAPEGQSVAWPYPLDGVRLLVSKWVESKGASDHFEQTGSQQLQRCADELDAALRNAYRTQPAAPALLKCKECRGSTFENRYDGSSICVECKQIYPQTAPAPVAGECCVPDAGEPSFVLLGRDPQAPAIIEAWALGRQSAEPDSDKPAKARAIAKAMREYKAANPDKGMSESSLTVAPVAGAAVESIAIALWHRFAPDDRIEWEDETEKAIYRDAAQQVAALAQDRASQAGEAGMPEGITPVYMICNAYESGFGKGQQGARRESPYDKSDHKEAWLTGYDEGAKRK